MRPILAVALASISVAVSAQSIDERIEKERGCIRFADAAIKDQREIGRTAGVVDKEQLYRAGTMRLGCSRRLEALLACRKTGKNCPAPDPLGERGTVPQVEGMDLSQ
jgi:hypothetical protein